MVGGWRWRRRARGRGRGGRRGGGRRGAGEDLASCGVRVARRRGTVRGAAARRLRVPHRGRRDHNRADVLARRVGRARGRAGHGAVSREDHRRGDGVARGEARDVRVLAKHRRSHAASVADLEVLAFAQVLFPKVFELRGWNERGVVGGRKGRAGERERATRTQGHGRGGTINGVDPSSASAPASKDRVVRGGCREDASILPDAGVGAHPRGVRSWSAATPRPLARVSVVPNFDGTPRACCAGSRLLFFRLTQTAQRR